MSASHEVVLAEAKLAPPRMRSQTIQRPRVTRALDAGETALTLVAAPAGYGKTTAVRAWCAARKVPVAWVTLDASDNDPARLWRYVITAVDRVHQGLARTALARLDRPGASIESAIDELMNSIAGLGRDLVIVLDDLHRVTDKACLESIDYGLEGFPSNARAVLLTRVDPALRLARLRAGGALTEVRTTELGFTVHETHELVVGRGGVPLQPDEVEMLHRRTNGWPAALVLAALWLRRVDDVPRGVREFGGDHRFVVDYLSNEVLELLPANSRSFVLQASVLGQFTAELCDDVLDRSDSAALLSELERLNLFVQALERGGWFRLHSMFAEFGRALLRSHEPDAAAEIHRRAAHWLHARGLPIEAVQHAAATGDHATVAEILSEHRQLLIQGGAPRTLLRWVLALPESQLLDHPELVVSGATAALMLGGRTIEQRRLLGLASRALDERPECPRRDVQAMSGMVRTASIDDGVHESVRQGLRAVMIAREYADDMLVAALAAYARALYLAGDPDQSWAAGLAAIEHPDAEQRPFGHVFARSTLALIAVDRGWLDSARYHAQKAKAIVGDVSSSRSWLGANAEIAVASVLAGEGNLAGAEQELVHAEHFFRDDVATVHHAWLLLLLAQVRCRKGRLDQAETAACEARAAIDELPDSGRLHLLAAEVAGELERLRSRADTGEMILPPTDAEFLVLRLLSSDLSAREIAAKLFLSPNTVRSHTRVLYRKLGVSTRADAVARADALGLF